MFTFGGTLTDLGQKHFIIWFVVKNVQKTKD